MLIDDIYEILPDKTLSGNVVIKPTYQKEGVALAKRLGGVFSLRLKHTNKHFGNPFSSVIKTEDFITTRNPRDSVKKYLDWVLNYPINFSEVTNHSGGALGADSMFDTIGKSFRQDSHKHYYFGNKTPKGNVLLLVEEVEEGIKEMHRAGEILKRTPKKKEVIHLLARNWFQVKNSNQIIAIAPIANSMLSVEGGTGWAVAMGQANNKEIFVFNLKDNFWYFWDGVEFSPSGCPILQKNFAGIGSRQDFGVMTPESVRAIEQVYLKSKVEMERLVWIRSILVSGQLKGRPIIYYKELGEPSHANALDYLINNHHFQI